MQGMSSEFKKEISNIFLVSRSFLNGISFIAMNSARDPNFFNENLLSYLSQDLLQSVYAIATLTDNGMQNAAKRELRFILETAIKLCYIQQEQGAMAISEKLTTFKEELNSPSISLKNRINLSLIPTEHHAMLLEETGRIYGQTSSYVHLSAAQVIERISAVNAGHTSGKESIESTKELISLSERALALSLVFIFHSIPKWVVGDFMIETSTALPDWHFLGSKYIAMIDANFDYKHERQKNLQEFIAARTQAVKF